MFIEHITYNLEVCKEYNDEHKLLAKSGKIILIWYIY